MDIIVCERLDDMEDTLDEIRAHITGKRWEDALTKCRVMRGLILAVRDACEECAHEKDLK